MMGQSQIRVFVADDHLMFRTVIHQIMQDQQDMALAGEAASGKALLDGVRAIRPDVAVFEIKMPDMPGLDAIERIRREAPETKIVVFTMQDKDAYVRKALSAGALGYVLKTSPAAELLSAIRAAHAGTYYLCSKVNVHILKKVF